MRVGRARDRVLEVRVGEDQVRALAAQLEREPLDGLGRQTHHLAARARRAGERHLVHARVGDEIRAGGRPVAGNDVDDARRNPDLDRELRETERRQRRRRIGLEDDRAPGRERRRELPAGHHHRVVPGDDLRADADRLAQRVEEERPAERMRAARDRRGGGGEEPEVLGRDSHLGLDARDRLADVARFEFRQLLAVRVDCVGQRVQEPRALGRGRLAPRALERRAGRRDRAVDVLFARPSRRGRAELRSPARSDRGRHRRSARPTHRR